MGIKNSNPVAEAGSLWAATVTRSSTECLQEHIKADVTVIGAGFTGLRAALKLAEAGTNVVLLDAGNVAHGATGRTGGQVNPVLPFNTPAKLLELLGPTYFERLRETSLGSADELFQTIKQYNIDCHARQNGWLRVLHSKKALRDAEAGVAEWNQFGANMSIVGQEEITQLSGTQAYKAGVITPKGGAIHPLALALGFAEAAKKNGCSMYGHSAVHSMKSVGNQWLVKTAQGQVQSDWVVIATNGYTGDLFDKLETSIIPFTSIQVATDPLPESVIGDVLPHGHTISDSRRIIMYGRREPDNRMVYGSHGKILPDGSISGADTLIRDATRVFPQLKNVEWTYKWGGRLALTDDHLPHFHEPRPGIVIGLGYNGRGVAMSNVMGRVLAERVLGAPRDALPFPNTAIKDVSYRPFKIWGMSTALWFMRLMDYLETR